MTTKGIARQAGVSIGSLYQYFANKDAVFGALIERELDAQVQIFRDLLERHRTDPLEVLVAAIVDEAVERFAETPALARLFIETVPLGRVPLVAEVRRLLARDFARELRRRGDYAEPLDPRIELLVHAVMGVFEARVLEPQSKAFEGLDVELTRLVVSYLRDLSS